MPPVIVAAIGGMLINLVGTLVGRVLIALGISVVTYVGVNASLGFAKAQALAAFTGMPAQAVSLASFLGVGTCISIISSAMLARAAISGITGDSFKKWVLK